MILAARVARLERALPAWNPSPEAERERLFKRCTHDAETVDLAIRLGHDRDARFKGMTPEQFAQARLADPRHRALLDRYNARIEELRAGAPLTTDMMERWGRRLNRLPPPGMVLP